MAVIIKNEFLLKPVDVRRIRSRLDMTQKQLADNLGVDRITIGRWESGKSTPHPIFARALQNLENR